MKNFIYLFLIVVLSSCSNSSAESKVKDVEQKPVLERKSYIIEMFLKSDAEKIGLLSVIKNVPQEKTNSVLREYLLKTFISEEFKANKNSEYIEKLVDSIAIKNKLPSILTASIIFSYKYEMTTKDEIIDDYEYLREEYLSQ